MRTVSICEGTWQQSFPHIVAPLADEWLSGLLLRCDEVNQWDGGTTAFDFLRSGKPGPLPSLIVTQWVDIDSLAQLLAIPRKALLATTYQVELARLYDTLCPHGRQLHSPFAFSFCPVCVSEARLLRRTLVLPHLRFCPIHHVRLLDQCPCGRRQDRFPSQPFTCSQCGLSWAEFPRTLASPERIALERKILTCYEFFLSQGTPALLARAWQLIRYKLVERKDDRLQRLDGRVKKVATSFREKISLGYLVDVLVSLDLSPSDIVADDGPVFWRPINWCTFSCPVSACPYMKAGNGSMCSSEDIERNSQRELPLTEK
jgi:hypothetical protein